MSILAQIEEHCKAGRLFKMEASGEIRAAKVPLSERRSLYMSPSVREFVMSDRALAAETEADFNDFVLGERFNVTLQLDHQFCLLARLDAAAEEVWEIRIWDTKPQLRFFGRFAKRDIFVALIGPVGRIRRTLNWKQIKRDCISEWEYLFCSAPLSKGDDIDAYLSNVDLV